MTNSDKFRHLFGIYATELWAMPESDFLKWLNADAQDTPTVDAVPVVRCKDCERWDGVPADETQDHECHLFDGNEEKIRIATPSYWFCPMGERRNR